LAVGSSSHVDVLGAAAAFTGKRHDPESGSESSGLVEAPFADALAMVPLTPGDGQAQGLRRSLREHKKPRPYYAGAEPQPPYKQPAGKGLQHGFFFFFFWVTGELSTLRQLMKVPNEPALSPNNGLEYVSLSDQSMTSKPRKGQAKRPGAKTTSHDGRAGHVMTHMCHPSKARRMASVTIQVPMQGICTPATGIAHGFFN